MSTRSMAPITVDVVAVSRDCTSEPACGTALRSAPGAWALGTAVGPTGFANGKDGLGLAIHAINPPNAAAHTARLSAPTTMPASARRAPARPKRSMSRRATRPSTMPRTPPMPGKHAKPRPDKSSDHTAESGTLPRLDAGGAEGSNTNSSKYNASHPHPKPLQQVGVDPTFHATNSVHRYLCLSSFYYTKT